MSVGTPVVPTAQALNQLTADVWQKAYNLLSEGQLQAIAQNIALVSENALDFGASTYQASVQSIITALGQVPAYVAAVEPVKGWEGLNFFLFSVTLYQQFNGVLLLPVLAGVSSEAAVQVQPRHAGSEPERRQCAGQGHGQLYEVFLPHPVRFLVLDLQRGLRRVLGGVHRDYVDSEHTDYQIPGKAGYEKSSGCCRRGVC